MRRSSYEYPLAYGRGYKAFPLARMGMHFRQARTFAIGTNFTLQAGLIASHIDYSRTTVDYIFRYRNDPRANIGKLLLKSYLEHCMLERDYETVGLEVVSNNTPARSLYESLGFVGGRTVKGSGHKLLEMELQSRAAIQQAITYLSAFSV